MKEYKIAKGWAIFIYITAPLIIIAFCFLFFMPFFPGNEKELKIFWILAPISLGMIAVGIIGLLDTIKGKFVIDTDRISFKSTLQNREILLNEIKGYRLTDKYILIEPTDEHIKKIKITSYFEKTEDIKEWLSDHYQDLDKFQAHLEKEEILNNEEFGLTKEQREETLAKAFKTARMLNIASGIVALWAMLYPHPYVYAVFASIAIPLISIFVLKYFNGLIRINQEKDSAYPSVFWAIFAPSMTICLRALFDFTIFDYAKIWSPSVLMTLAFVVILLIGNKEFKFNTGKKIAVIISLSVFLFAYSFGTIITLNCVYDKSQPEIYSATVLNKRISSGKSTTYYLELTPWGPQKKVEEFSVPGSLYKKLEKGNEVKINLMKGQFKIPWIEITE